MDYSPYVADAINLTSGLTPASPAIAIGSFAVLAVALVAIGRELRPQSRRLRYRVIGLSCALVLIGIVTGGLADLRLNAISEIFGLEGPGSPDLYGTWLLVQTAGSAMAVAGVAGLAVTALIAITRLRNSTRPGDVNAT